jgi:flagellin
MDQSVAETATGLRDAFQKMIDANDELKGNYVVSGSGATVTISAIKGGNFEGNKGVMSAFTAAAVATGGSVGAASTGTTTAAVQASRTLTMPPDAEVAAGLTGKGITINGTTLEFYDATKGAYTGSAQGIDIGGITTKTSLTDAIVAQAKISGVILSNASDNLKVTAAQGGLAGNSIATADGGIQQEFKATFQVGTNQGQGFTIDVNDMRSLALKIAGTASATDAATGAKFTSSNVVTNGTDAISREAALDVSNNTNATNAIKVLDNAIQSVSAERSKLGAFQNRLEHTISNLGTSSENLTAAESRIRDVDYAEAA